MISESLERALRIASHVMRDREHYEGGGEANHSDSGYGGGGNDNGGNDNSNSKSSGESGSNNGGYGGIGGTASATSSNSGGYGGGVGGFGFGGGSVSNSSSSGSNDSTGYGGNQSSYGGYSNGTGGFGFGGGNVSGSNESGSSGGFNSGAPAGSSTGGYGGFGGYGNSDSVGGGGSGVSGLGNSGGGFNSGSSAGASTGGYGGFGGYGNSDSIGGFGSGPSGLGNAGTLGGAVSGTFGGYSSANEGNNGIFGGVMGNGFTGANVSGNTYGYSTNQDNSMGAHMDGNVMGITTGPGSTYSNAMTSGFNGFSSPMGADVGPSTKSFTGQNPSADGQSSSAESFGLNPAKPSSSVDSDGNNVSVAEGVDGKAPVTAVTSAPLGTASTSDPAETGYGSFGPIGGTTAAFGMPGMTGPGTDALGAYGYNIGQNTEDSANYAKTALPDRGVMSSDVGVAAGYASGVPSMVSSDVVGSHIAGNTLSGSPITGGYGVGTGGYYSGSGVNGGYDSGGTGEETGDPSNIDGEHALTVHGLVDTGRGFASLGDADAGLTSKMGTYGPGDVKSISPAQGISAISDKSKIGFDNFGPASFGPRNSMVDHDGYSVPGWSVDGEIGNTVQNPGSYFGNDYSSLQGKNYSRGFASGLLGNFSVESGGNSVSPGGIDPTAVNPTSGAFGIAQDLGSRKRGVLSAMGLPSNLKSNEAQKYAEGTMPEQTGYALSEVAGLGYALTRSDAEDPDVDPHKVTRDVMNEFEAPSMEDRKNSIDARYAATDAWSSRLNRADQIARANPGISSIGPAYGYDSGVTQSNQPVAMASAGPSYSNYVGPGFSNMADAGSVSYDGNMTAGPTESDSYDGTHVLTVNRASSPAAAESAGFANPSLATGVAAAFAQATGVGDTDSYISAINNDPRYSDVKSLINSKEATADSVAKALTQGVGEAEGPMNNLGHATYQKGVPGSSIAQRALGNDANVVNALAQNGNSIDNAAIAAAIAKNTLAAANSNKDGVMTADKTSSPPVSLGGLSGAPMSDSTTPASFSFNGSADPSSTAAAPDLNITKAPDTPAEAAKNAEAAAANPHPIASKAIDMAVGLGVPAVGVANVISKLFGGPTVGSLLTKSTAADANNPAVTRAAGNNNDAAALRQILNSLQANDYNSLADGIQKLAASKATPTISDPVPAETTGQLATRVAKKNLPGAGPAPTVNSPNYQPLLLGSTSGSSTGATPLYNPMADPVVLNALAL